MKFWILAAFAFMAVASVQANDNLTAEQKKKLQDHAKICVAESGADEKIIQKARQKEFTDDAKLKAYYVCMFKRLQFVDAAEKFNVDLMIKKLPVKTKGLGDIIKGCVESAESKGALNERVFAAFKCFVEKSNEPISFN